MEASSVSLAKSLPSEQPIEKSATIWFEDGNIILRTKSKLYRAHRAVLGAHSTVFRDMFSIPQPESQDLIDGCPVVDVTDAAQEWDALFDVMYGFADSHILSLGYTIPARGRLAHLRAALVLGTKYDFRYYKWTAQRELTELFPQTLDEWDEILKQGSISRRHGAEVLTLLEFVVSFGESTMHPAAYYACTRYCPIDKILSQSRLETDRPLAEDVIDRLVLCQGPLMQAFTHTVFKWCWDNTIPSANCLSPQECSKTVFDTYNNDMAGSLYHVRLLLEPFDRFGKCSGMALCIKCKKVATRAHQKGRELVWDELPKYYGLESWENLRSDEDE